MNYFKLLFLLLFLGCGGSGEPHQRKQPIPFQPVKQTPVEKDIAGTPAEYIGQYELQLPNENDTDRMFKVYVYIVMINGKKREVHWNGEFWSNGAFGVLNLERIEE